MAKRKQISVRPLRRRGGVRWIVDRFEEGIRRRSFYPTKRDAETEASRLRQQADQVGSVWLSLPPNERDELLKFRQACIDRGLPLWDLLRAYDNREFHVATASPTLQEVINELVTAKDAAGRSKRYTEILQIILDGFAKGRESQRIAGITVADVDRWLDTKKLAGRPTFKARLATLFNFAVKRGYRPDNPCSAVEAPAPPRTAPAIFTVRQTARCLVFLRRRDPRALGWFVLSTLCGLRPEEAEQTTWDAVQIDNGEAHVRVEAQTSKVRQRRIVTPLPAAVAWLKIARDAGSELPLSSQVRRTAIRRLRDMLHWEEWPKDVTRHTAASYWLAVDGNPVNVAEQLGHSVAQLKTHYKALVTRTDAERFWGLIPKADPKRL
jgi:integrase